MTAGRATSTCMALVRLKATHVKFTGQAKISPGWTAGYTIRIQNLEDNPFGRNATTGDAMNQFNDNFSTGLNTQMSYWFIQSETLGKLSMGRQANAAKSAAMFTDQSGTQIIDNYTFRLAFRSSSFVRAAISIRPLRGASSHSATSRASLLAVTATASS